MPVPAAVPIAMGAASALSSLFGGSKGNKTGAAPWWEVGNMLNANVLNQVFRDMFLKLPPGDPRNQMMQNIMQWLSGQISPISYERAQETANRGLGTWMQQLGRLQGQSGSGVGGAMANAGLGNWYRQTNEAARDYALAGEAARAQGGQALMQLLQQVFANQAAKAGAMAGSPVQNTYQAGDQNIWGNLSNALGLLSQKDWSKPSGTGVYTEGTQTGPNTWTV